MRLKDKVALVTGSTSGIGLAIAQLFASEGAKVLIAARKADVAQQVVADIKAQGGEALFVPLEVTDQQQWAAAVQQAKTHYGGLHILVNDAGTNELCALPTIELDHWNNILATNVTGPMLGMQLCAPLMKESGGGSIVNIASLGGMLGTPSTAYSTSKWALRGLSASAAYSLASWGIRSNTICPGFIEHTHMTEAIAQANAQNPLASSALLGRAGSTMELAQAALFLASDDSSYITGIDIPVDGGLHDAGIYAIARSNFAAMAAGATPAKAPGKP